MELPSHKCRGCGQVKPNCDFCTLHGKSTNTCLECQRGYNRQQQAKNACRYTGKGSPWRGNAGLVPHYRRFNIDKFLRDVER